MKKTPTTQVKGVLHSSSFLQRNSFRDSWKVREAKSQTLISQVSCIEMKSDCHVVCYLDTLISNLPFSFSRALKQQRLRKQYNHNVSTRKPRERGSSLFEKTPIWASSFGSLSSSKSRGVLASAKQRNVSSAKWFLPQLKYATLELSTQFVVASALLKKASWAEWLSEIKFGTIPKRLRFGIITPPKMYLISWCFWSLGPLT